MEVAPQSEGAGAVSLSGVMFKTADALPILDAVRQTVAFGIQLGFRAEAGSAGSSDAADYLNLTASQVRPGLLSHSHLSLDMKEIPTLTPWPSESVRVNVLSEIFHLPVP